MRDRLIELLKQDPCPDTMLCDANCKYVHLERCYEERTADHLIANGVIVPPCKVGDKLYVPKHGSNEIVECEVTQVRIIFSKHKGKTIQIYFNSGNKLTEVFFSPIDFKFGFVCLTKKEAKAKLKEGAE